MRRRLCHLALPPPAVPVFVIITNVALPLYSPNLNLIERFWKFLKRKVARNRYHATFTEFRAAVQKVLNNLAAYRAELASLLTERCQLFTTP